MDAMTLLAETRSRLRSHEGSYAEIARQSGLSYSSLVKLAQGHTPNPTVDSLQKVIGALDAYEEALATEPPMDDIHVVPFEAPP